MVNNPKDEKEIEFIQTPEDELRNKIFIIKDGKLVELPVSEITLHVVHSATGHC